MVQLWLSKPESGDLPGQQAVEDAKSFIESLESLLWSVIESGGGRYEARMWLSGTISCIPSITPSFQRDLFLDLLRTSSRKRDLAAQLLQIILDRWPERVGPIVARNCFILEKFFRGNHKRILLWFDNFASISEHGHKRGARALSQYAFVNRDDCWDVLEWKGRHGQSPAVVATKPHYFRELDVIETVENFIKYVPDFWSSNELAESVEDGAILQIDTAFFVDQFVSLMYEDDLEDIWVVVKECLEEEKFSFLCRRLFILLDDCGVLSFLKSISTFLSAKLSIKDFENPSYWLEDILRTSIDCISLDELYILAAVINQRRQLRLRLDGEDLDEEKRKAEELLKTSIFCRDSGHWALSGECTVVKRKTAVKWIALQSWALYYLLSKECNTPDRCESVLVRNGISFRRANEYSIVQSNFGLKEFRNDTNDKDLSRQCRKKRKRERKMSKNRDPGDIFTDELLLYEKLDNWQCPTLAGGWLLSTDNYSSTWQIADLPEYLSKLFFSTWMKLVSRDVIS